MYAESARKSVRVKQESLEACLTVVMRLLFSRYLRIVCMHVSTAECIVIALDTCENFRNVKLKKFVSRTFNRYTNICQTFGLNCLKYFFKKLPLYSQVLSSDMSITILPPAIK